MARGFWAGAIWGLVLSGVGAGALSVAMGPPANRATPPAMPPVATDPVAEAVESRSARTEPPSGGASAPESSGSESAGPESSAEPGPQGAVQEGQERAPEVQPEPQPAPVETAETVSEAGSGTTAAADSPADEQTPPQAAADRPEEAAPADDPADDPAEAISDNPETPTPPPARRPSEEQGVEPVAAGPALSPPALAEGGAPDTRPTQRPEAIPAPLSPDAPGTAEGARLAIDGDAPVQPGLPALPPEVPLAEAEPALSTDPAQPPQPAQDSSLAPAPSDSAQTETGAEAGSAMDAPAESSAGEGAVSEEPETPGTWAAPRVTTQIPERPAEAPAAEGPGLGTPAGSLLAREPAAESTARGIGEAPAGRLPVITEGSPAEGPEQSPPGSAPGAAMGEDTPLHRYAASYTLAADEPAMSILLIDDGSGPLGPETVEAFPFPVSFAIAPGHPDPAGAAAGYRARGFEVLALADLPENATPADAEVALQGALSTVPEAIAVLEGADLALQHDRAISEQAAEFLGASGHGLVMMPNGLNTAEALARRAGVPSLTVFRDFDGKGQDPRVMRRFLDQAAFKARQDESVVMLGRLRADTVSALLLWGLQDRASSVALVPVSALLLRQDGAN